MYMYVCMYVTVGLHVCVGFNMYSTSEQLYSLNHIHVYQYLKFNSIKYYQGDFNCDFHKVPLSLRIF